MTTSSVSAESNLSQTWDDILTRRLPEPTPEGDADFLWYLHHTLSVSGPAPELADSLWATIVDTSVQSLVPSPVTATATASPERTNWVIHLISYLPTIAWMVAAGLAGGFIAGISSRIMMRISGLLTIQVHRFIETQAGATVGKITLGGTLFLGGLGAAAGVLAAGFYVAIRPRLPFDGWRRSAAFAALLLLVFGYVIMNPNNDDYHTFGPAWLNILNFSSLYLIMGFTIAQIYEHRPAIVTGFSNASGRRWLSIAIKAPVYLAIIGAGVLFSLIAMIIGRPALLIPLVLLICWLVAHTNLMRFIRSVSIPPAVQRWGVWVVPGVVGFILTARGVTEILLNR
jgi:hypothetical protein